MTQAKPDLTRRIRWIGRGMFVVTIVMAAGSAVGYALLCFMPGGLDQAIRSQILPGDAPYTLTPAVVLVSLILAAFPVAAIEWGLWNAALLFRAYATGVVLTEETGHRLRRFGAALIALPVLAFVMRPIGTFLVTINNPPGQRQIALSADLSGLIYVVAGGLIIGIGWVMVEAARAADENRGFV